jgi:hypothetical protein
MMGETEAPLDIKLKEQKSAPSELAVRVQSRQNFHELLFRAIPLNLLINNVHSQTLYSSGYNHGYGI